MPPLILTLALDPDSFARLDALRRARFPAHLNRIPAHVTLFHALPGEEEARVLGDLAGACAALAPVPATVGPAMSLGRGAALRVACPPVAALRGHLAGLWASWLTPQDRQGWRPHVTVQNKVAPEEARATLALLQAEPPWGATATGLLLWRYLGGPWERAAFVPFAGLEAPGQPK